MIKKMMMAKVAEIEDTEYQVRGVEDVEDMDDLKSSIRNLGMLQPIVCVDSGERMQVVAGHRRYKAAKELGLDEVPVSVVYRDKEKTWAMSLSENFVRADLTPVEQAAAMKDLIDGGVYDIRELARLMRRTTRWIEEQIDLVDWPADVQLAVHLGQMSVSAAKNLAEIEDDAARGYLVKYAVENGATARITAAWLQAHRAGSMAESVEGVEPKGKVSPAAPIEPHCPCCICGQVIKMINLSYLPICADCNDQVIAAVRDNLRSGRVDS